MEATRLRVLALIFLPLLFTAKACAAVLFVIPEYSPNSIALVNKTNQHLTEDIDIKTVEDVDSRYLQQYKAVVLVGSTVLDQWTGSSLPTVAILVSYKQAQQHKNILASSVYADPPLSRQVLLAIELLGERNPIGILFKNRQQLIDYNIEDVSVETWRQMKIGLYFSDESESIAHALVPLLNNNNALVGIYDNDLYSPESIKTILISAYRQNVPLIGPSAAYLKAGALASTYSNLDDTALRLSEVLKQGFTTNKWPAADYNPYFHVGFNEQVGRSLNILLPNAETLANKIRAIEAADKK